MERSLFVMNKTGASFLLEKEELHHFEEVFSYLYDEDRNINRLQKVDKSFLSAWSLFDQELLSPVNQLDSARLFQKESYVLFEYNLNPLALTVRLEHNKVLLSYIEKNHCTLSEAIHAVDQSHLWA